MAGPISEAWWGMEHLQSSDVGQERYANKVTGGEGVSIGVQCGC